VASIYSIGLSHMNRFVQRFLRDYPKANVHVQYQHPRRVYELVETDQVDLGLVSYPRSTRTIKATTWREEPMVVVCAPSNRLASQPSISAQDLKGIDVIGFDADLEIRSEIDRALAAHGVEVRVTMEFDNTETIKRAVEIDAGVSLLPEPTIDREVAAGALVARPLAGVDLKRPIGIVQRRGKELGKTARRFMQLLLKQSAVGGIETEQEIVDDEATDSDATDSTAESPEIMDDGENELTLDKAALAARVGS
jgi:DNA-binding transcriptional LysR family regulator